MVGSGGRRRGGGDGRVCLGREEVRPQAGGGVIDSGAGRLGACLRSLVRAVGRGGMGTVRRH